MDFLNMIFKKTGSFCRSRLYELHYPLFFLLKTFAGPRLIFIIFEMDSVR